MNPEEAGAWYNKGLALYDMGKYEEAIKAYDKAIEINPEEAGAWYNKGLALYDMGKYEEAIKAYDKAIEINPEEAGAWYTAQVGVSLLGAPVLGRAHRLYGDNLRAKLKDRIEKFDHFDSISTEVKSRIRPRVANAIEQVIAFDAWEGVIDKFFDKVLTILSITVSLYLVFALVMGGFVAFEAGLEFYLKFGITAIGSVYVISKLLSLFKVQNAWTVGLITIFYTLIAWALVTREIVWVSQAEQCGLAIGFSIWATLLWVLLIVFWFKLLVYKFIDRKMWRQYPEACIVDSLILALALAEEKPNRQRVDEVKSNLLFQLESIARRFENELPHKLPSYDTGTDVWLHNRGHEMAAGIRQLKRCVLLHKAESQELLAAKLGKKLVNAIDGDWDLFARVEPPAVLNWRSKIFRMLRTLVAMSFPLLIVGIIEVSPIKLNDSVMGYIAAAAIGWVGLNILTWLDPDYSEKTDYFKDKTDLLRRRKSK